MSRRRIAFATWAAGLGLAAGCGPSASDPAASTPPAATEPVATQSTPTPVVPDAPVVAQVPPPVPAPTPFAFPSDTAGKKVAAVLTNPTTSVPAEPLTSQPTPRTSEIDRGDQPLVKVVASVPSVPSPMGKSPQPSAPAERVPNDLGHAAAENPAAVKFPEKPPVRAASPVNPGAADVPLLARPTPDRAAIDDPTAEIATQRAVFTPLPTPALTIWYTRFSIPDPFEFVEHLKGKTGTNQELGTTPVIVPPGKM